MQCNSLVVTASDKRKHNEMDVGMVKEGEIEDDELRCEPCESSHLDAFDNKNKGGKAKSKGKSDGTCPSTPGPEMSKIDCY